MYYMIVGHLARNQLAFGSQFGGRSKEEATKVLVFVLHDLDMIRPMASKVQGFKLVGGYTRDSHKSATIGDFNSVLRLNSKGSRFGRTAMIVSDSDSVR